MRGINGGNLDRIQLSKIRKSLENISEREIDSWDKGKWIQQSMINETIRDLFFHNLIYFLTP